MHQPFNASCFQHWLGDEQQDMISQETNDRRGKYDSSLCLFTDSSPSASVCIAFLSPAHSSDPPPTTPQSDIFLFRKILRLHLSRQPSLQFMHTTPVSANSRAVLMSLFQPSTCSSYNTRPTRSAHTPVFIASPMKLGPLSISRHMQLGLQVQEKKTGGS